MDKRGGIGSRHGIGNEKEGTSFLGVLWQWEPEPAAKG